MVDTPHTIDQDFDFYVPAFEVRLKGRSLDRAVLRDVLSVTYTDSLDKLDSCQITLNNWDADARAFKYLDFSDREGAPAPFKPGTELELAMGYHDRGGLTPMLRGQIVSIEPDFPAAGQPIIQIRALNQLYTLHFKQVTEFFEGKTDTQIAQAVLEMVKEEQNKRRSAAGQTPLEMVLETLPENAKLEQPLAYMVISNEYPIVFLLQRARHNGYDLYVEEVEEGDRTVSKLHFHPPSGAVPAPYTLTWGRSLINFKPTLKTKDQVAKVTVRGWNPVRSKKEIVGTATWDDLPFRGLPSVEAMQAVDSALVGSEEVIADRPILDEAEAKSRAKDYLARLAKTLVTGSGSTVGVPGLRAGRPVFLEGLGPLFSGRYLVTATTHSIGDGGYTTQFEARMETIEQREAAA